MDLRAARRFYYSQAVNMTNFELGNSKYWNIVWEYYSNAPSIALCRVPELEYATSLDISCRILDHCCGDGKFAGIAWQGRKLTAGCDANRSRVLTAQKSNIYRRLDVCDASKILPYENGAYDMVFNNSALEHIADLDTALSEVDRVLAPGGTFAFNVLNHRYFEWWPRSSTAMKAYRRWQPFYHALNLTEWTVRLKKCGLKIDSVEGYIDRQGAEELACLDHSFSSLYMTFKPVRPLWWYLRIPYLMKRYWQKRLCHLIWKTEADSGAGYFIKATKSGI